MYKIAVIGDYDSIYGFAALGLDIYPAANRKEAEEKLEALAGKGYGIIYITEGPGSRVQTDYREISGTGTAAIIQIPGVSGNTGMGVQGVKDSVERAVGSDILFSNN